MKKKEHKKKVVIIGAGPAGLATAYELCKSKRDQFEIIIFESDSQTGGLSKTLLYQGLRFDLGGHRFYTKIPEIQKLYRGILDKDMLRRQRLSRIYYDGKYFQYPLSVINTLKNLGPKRSGSIILSWLKRSLNRHQNEKTFQQWVSNRFGDELFKTFFKSYTEKVWGVSTDDLSADWASQRIQNFSLPRAVFNALFKINPGAKTVITTFHYPKYGPGMFYDKIVHKMGSHVTLHLSHEVVGLEHAKNNVTHVLVKTTASKKVKRVRADYVVSTMPFQKLVKQLKPPRTLVHEMKSLTFRSLITVNLILKSNPFPDQWIYVHDPRVKVGRIQNFQNWSPFMRDEIHNRTPIGMEYFSNEGDVLWKMSDAKLLQQAKKELVKLKLAKASDIVDGFVYRVKDAYPVYNFDYQAPLAKAKDYLNTFDNVYVCGRGGMFQYNNQDHSIYSGFLTARNIVANRRTFDVWSINDSGYLEESNQ